MYLPNLFWAIVGVFGEKRKEQRILMEMSCEQNM